MNYEPERQDSILTSGHRNYLLGRKEDLSQRAKEQTKSRIRKRVRHGLLDFNLLLNMNQKEREMILNPVSHAEESADDLSNAVSYLLQFAYLQLKDSDREFDDVLSTAIREAEKQRSKERGDVSDISVNVETEVNKDSVDVEKVKKKIKMESWDSISNQELGLLTKKGLLEADTESLVLLQELRAAKAMRLEESTPSLEEQLRMLEKR